MNSANPIQLVIHAAERLGDLRSQVTFLGGAIVGLLVTDPAARPPRATRDVDVVVELASRVAYYQLDEALRARGFRNVPEGPVCRYEDGSIVLDVMPTNPEILGFANRWYPAAIHSAQTCLLDSGVEINLVTPACFLATKMEAFNSPVREDHGDMLLSRDFEDMIVLIDGRPAIVEDVLNADADVREYLQGRFRRQTAEPSWLEGVEAHVYEGRAAIVAERVLAFVDPG